MNRECPIAIHCGLDFGNYSSEGPEVFAWTATAYCCDGTLKLATSLISQIEANRASDRMIEVECPDCDQPQKYCADAVCPDGSLLTTICTTTSQEDADKLADKAETIMLPLCPEKEDLYQANCSCPDGVTDPHTVYSSISEAVAQAQCDFIPKTCPGTPNAGATCTVKCPDGTTFTYTLPAGTVVAATQAEADAIAQTLACEEANRLKMCLAPMAGCSCLGVVFDARIYFLEGARNSVWTISLGTLPPGLGLLNATGIETRITGTPTAAGQYQFTLRATDDNGNFAEKVYQIYVIEITTSSLTSYTVGQAYSSQLAASGGSGNYRWSIQSGALPDGLTMSDTGLISGTPTGIDSGTMPIIFSVSDLICEAEQKSKFPPKATLTTTSITTTRTKHGWFAYGTNSGTLYKRFDVTGSHTQTAQTSPLVKPQSLGLEFCGGAKQTYSGYCAINLYGLVVHLHDKHLLYSCDLGAPVVQTPFLQPDNTFFWTPEDNVSTLLGYCWEDDPESCDSCSETEADWIDGGNYAQANSRDIPWNMLVDEDQIITTPTVLTYNHTAERFFDRIVREDLSYPTGFPHGSTNVYEIDEPWVRISSTGNFSITLSEPFSDDEAESTKVVTTGLGSVANGGTTTQWATQYIKHVAVRITEVRFNIHCTNLIVGEEYTVTYELWNQTTNAKTTVTVTFTAIDDHHDVLGTVPTPAVGQSVKIRNARIRLT